MFLDTEDENKVKEKSNETNADDNNKMANDDDENIFVPPHYSVSTRQETKESGVDDSGPTDAGMMMAGISAFA